MPKSAQKLGNGKGLVYVNIARLDEERIRMGLSETDLCNGADVSPKTMAHLRRGGGIRPSTLSQLATFLKIDPIELLVKGQACDSGKGRLPEWTMVESLGDWHEASNGLKFQVWKLEHQSLPRTLGRGKCYHIERLSDREQRRLKDVLLRHPQVCRRFRGEPNIPINLNVFPEQDGKTWWAIDEWVEGHTLEQIIKLGPVSKADLPSIMKQIAAGLQSLRRAVIVRRDLAPWNILIRNSDRAVMLTDFEMSKLFDGSPTVAGKWQANPYRAPEVNASVPPDVRVDLFSWARIFVHAASGRLPECGQEQGVLEQLDLPPCVRNIALRCLAPMDDRPKTIDDVLDAMQNWK